MKLEIKEMLTRFANGGFTKVFFTADGILLTWDKGVNPLEASGIPSPYSTARFKYLQALVDSEYIEFGFGETLTFRFLVIYVPSKKELVTKYLFKVSGISIPDCVDYKTNYVSKDLFSALNVIRNSFTATGVIDFDNVQVKDPIVELPKWSLHKETYTNQEVQELLEEFKKEMVESTNQLFNRFINRISK